MNRKFLLKIVSSLVLTAGMLVASCSDEETMEVGESVVSDVSGIKVGKVGDWVTPITRAPEQLTLNPDAPVLIFDDTATYNKTIRELREMTELQRQKFYAKIGFESASLLLDKADQELDSIFDMENVDSMAFVNKINNYKEKYDGAFKFDSEDEMDVTPNLHFLNPDLALVANLDGLVVIGDNLVVPNNESPNNSAINLVQTQDPPFWTGVDFQKAPGCELKNSSGKYRSIIYIGYDKNSKWVIAYFRTYKKVLGFKKKKNSRHFGKVTISCGNTILASQGVNVEERVTNHWVTSQDIILSATPQPPYTNTDNVVDIKIENFSSDYCKTPIGTTFTNVNIYAE